MVAKVRDKHNNWFKHRMSALQEIGASPLMMCFTDVRVLPYGCSADAMDDYVWIGKDTISKPVRRYTRRDYIFGQSI
jgi:hypothetical protein